MTSWRDARLWHAVGLVARLVLAVVFIWFGIAKAENPAEFRVAIDAYRLVPHWGVGPMAAVLPYLEIAAGVLLLLGLATRLAAVLTALMMLAFIFGISWAVIHGLSIDCGCSGGGGAVAAGQTQYTLEILRDVGLLILAVYLIVRPHSWLSVDGLAGRGSIDDDDSDDDDSDDDDDDDSADENVGRTLNEETL